MTLIPAQFTRYARQLLLPGVGMDGQQRLLAATVRLCDGGVAVEEAAIYLAAAGVGRLVLSEELAARLGASLVARNPDVEVVTEGAADLTLASLEPDTRRVGTMAALAALVELTGAAGPLTWADEETEIRWTRS